MFSLRRLITVSPLKSSRSASCSLQHSFKRQASYLHRGTRIRGIARDEADYLVSPKGIHYKDAINSITPLKQLLGETYELNDDLLVQTLTHKSFAHGSRPFNEKLAVYGAHFIKYKASLYTLSKEGIEGLGSKHGKHLISTPVLAEFIRSNNIGDCVFWKKRDPLETNAHISGENSIYARSCEALVGGLLLSKGKATAEKFVDEVLLNENLENSLVSIANRS